MNSFFLVCLATLLVAQPDDENKKSRRMKNRIERRELQNSIEEITYHDRWKRVATFRVYDKANRRLLEEHYRDFQLRIRHGQTRAWYPNGQLQWTCDFKDSQINGPYFSYYEDGTLKRRELYKLGTARKGECFSSEGTPVACRPLIKKAEFEGGKKQFITVLKERLRHIQPTEPSFFFTLEGTLSEEGILFGLKPLAYIQNRPPEERELARQLVSALRDMPRWQPVIVDDQPIASDLLISIYFSNGKVFGGSYDIQ